MSVFPRKSAGKACSMMTAPFLVGICQKQCFLHYSKRRDAGNSVSCITPNGKMLETVFLALLQMERCWKQCFLHYSKWKDAGNSVSCITPNGKMLETVFLALLQMERCWKQCFCVLSRWSEKENNVTSLFRRESINGNNVVTTRQSILTTETAFPQYCTIRFKAKRRQGKVSQQRFFCMTTAL